MIFGKQIRFTEYYSVCRYAVFNVILGDACRRRARDYNYLSAVKQKFSLPAVGGHHRHDNIAFQSPVRLP